jgi:hypothetical protein
MEQSHYYFSLLFACTVVRVGHHECLPTSIRIARRMLERLSNLSTPSFLHIVTWMSTPLLSIPGEATFLSSHWTHVQMSNVRFSEAWGQEKFNGKTYQPTISHINGAGGRAVSQSGASRSCIDPSSSFLNGFFRILCSQHRNANNWPIVSTI